MDAIGIAWYIMGPISSLENMWASAAGNLAVVILFFCLCRFPWRGCFIWLIFITAIYVFSFSAWLFLQEKRGRHPNFALVQEVLRFLTFRCSNCALPLTCREGRNCRRLDEYLSADPL
nr:hypothetical protein [Pseudescherichia vulneris]